LININKKGENMKCQLDENIRDDLLYFGQKLMEIETISRLCENSIELMDNLEEYDHVNLVYLLHREILDLRRIFTKISKDLHL